MSEKTLADIAAVAFSDARSDGALSSDAWQRTAAAVEAEVLRRLRDGAGELETRLRIPCVHLTGRECLGMRCQAADALAACRAEKPTEAIALDGEMTTAQVFLHSNGFSTERNMVTAIMHVLNLDATDFRLRDKLISACSGWINQERKVVAREREAALNEKASPRPVRRTNAEIAEKLRDMVKTAIPAFKDILTDAAARVEKIAEPKRMTAGERLCDVLIRKLDAWGDEWNDIDTYEREQLEEAAAELGIGGEA